MVDIVVAGGGSIGTVLAISLTRAGYSVKLLRRKAPFGVIPIRCVGRMQDEKEIEVISMDNLYGFKGIILITVQEQHTLSFCIELEKQEIHQDTILVSLQNGVSPVSNILKIFPTHPLIQGIIWWSATLIDPHTVLYHRAAETILGIPPKSLASPQHLSTVMELLLKSGFQVKLSDNMDNEIWKKLVLNVVSPVLAMVKQPYPEGLAIPQVRALIHALFDECYNLAKTTGKDLSDPKLIGFHRILREGVTLKSTQGQFIHKVSTQIGIEKYGGKGSNVDELLGPFIDLGSHLAKSIRDYIHSLPPTYKALSPEKLTTSFSLQEGSCLLLDEFSQ